MKQKLVKGHTPGEYNEIFDECQGKEKFNSYSGCAFIVCGGIHGGQNNAACGGVRRRRGSYLWPGTGSL